MSSKQLPENATPTEGAGLLRREADVPARRVAIARATHDDLAHADKVLVEGLEVFANHGVYPAENELGQKFVISLVLYADLRAAGECDDLDASIDYGAVCHEVDSFVREHTFKLIEAVAEGVAGMLLRAHPQLLGVHVKVEKPWAPVGLPLRTCGVEIERLRK